MKVLLSGINHYSPFQTFVQYWALHTSFSAHLKIIFYRDSNRKHWFYSNAHCVLCKVSELQIHKICYSNLFLPQCFVLPGYFVSQEKRKDLMLPLVWTTAVHAPPVSTVSPLFPSPSQLHVLSLQELLPQCIAIKLYSVHFKIFS